MIGTPARQAGRPRARRATCAKSAEITVPLRNGQLYLGGGDILGTELLVPASWFLEQASWQKWARQRMSAEPLIELRVPYASQNAFFADYTRNIRRGGTFIATPRPLPVGSALAFELTVPGFEQSVKLNGIVQWISDSDSPDGLKKAGMGIAFTFDSESDKLNLEARIEKLLKETFGFRLAQELLADTSAVAETKTNPRAAPPSR